MANSTITTTTESTLKTLAPRKYTDSELKNFVNSADFVALDYYHTMASSFLGSPNKQECEGCLSLGVELESDNFGYDGTNRPEYVAGGIKAYLGNDMDTKHDGSLNHGMEIASQPATLDYHMTKYMWRDTLKLLSMYSESHDAGSCGLHVHVNRKALGHTDDARDLVVAKLLYLVEKWFVAGGALGKFSRRDMTDYDQMYWCKKNNLGLKSTDSRKVLDEKMKAYKNSDEAFDRYNAINLTNAHTIEFRMFRGTHNPETFAATLQLVDCMVRYCKTHTLTEVQNCRFGDIVATCKYAELAAYCNRRGICLRQTRNA